MPIDDVAGTVAALRAFVASGLPRRAYPIERFRVEAMLPAFDALYARRGV